MSAPDLESLRSCSSVLDGSDVIAAKMEEVVDRVVSGEEPLCLAGRLEPLHLAFSASGWLMRIFGSIVGALVPTMLDTRHQLAFGSAVARELVRDHHARYAALPLQQFAQQTLGRPLVASALHQGIKDDAGLVNRAPQPVLHPGDHDDDLIEGPFVARAGQPPPDLVGQRLAELPGPLPHGLVADDDATAASISSTMRKPSGKRK